MRAGELANLLDLDLVGNSEAEIVGISYPERAIPSDVVIAKNRGEIEKTKANVVITAPCFIQTPKSMLFTYDNLELIMVKVCDILVEYGYLKDHSKPVFYKMNEQNVGIGSNVSVGKNITIEPGALIGDDVVIGDNTVIGAGVKIGSGTKIGNDVCIDSGTVIGADSFFHYGDRKLVHFKGIGRAIIHDGVHIGSHCVVQRGTISDTVIGNNCMIGNCIDIGHDVIIGRNCKIVSQTGIAGNAVIGDNVLIYGQAGIANNVKVGNYAVVKGKTLVSKSVSDKQTVFGLYGRELYKELKLQAKIRKIFEREE